MKFKILKNWGKANELYKWLISKKLLKKLVVKTKGALNNVIQNIFIVNGIEGDSAQVRRSDVIKSRNKTKQILRSIINNHKYAILRK